MRGRPRNPRRPRPRRQRKTSKERSSMNFSNVRISTKLAGAFGLVLLGYIGAVGYSWYSISAVGESVQDYVTGIAVRRNDVSGITRHYSEGVHALKNFILR